MHQVTVIPGDGIGPEIVSATQEVLAAAAAPIAWDTQHAGASVFRQGIASGVPAETIASIQSTRCVLKGPLETPVGFGEKSANVTLRKLFETYANIRPAREFPGVVTPYSGRGIDLIVVRENVEDLYAGIEHMQTPNVAQCLKLISRQGCERIVRLAFEVARSEGRPAVTCATKANIMKMTEGLLKRTFEEIAPEYPDIRADHIIVDNCAHQLVKRPEQFDVIVTTNMNGDILSDLTSALVGGLGFAPSANIGDDVAIFEAVHGSAPKYAGTDAANPTAVLLSAVLMLRHLGELTIADTIEQALIVTLERNDARTRDVAGDHVPAGTRAFAAAVIANLGETSAVRPPRPRRPLERPASRPDVVTLNARAVVGMDLFVESTLDPDALGESVGALVADLPVRLKMISNRGTQVFPSAAGMTDCVDQFRCRLVARDPDRSLTDADLASAIAAVGNVHPWMHIEKLQSFDGAPSYTKAQGED